MAIALEFEPRGFDDFLGRLHRAPGRLAHHVDTSGDRAAQHVVRAARRRAPKRRGRLAASIRARRVSKFKWAVGSDLPYAAIHEFGGTIHARRAPYLVFQVNGRWVKTKSVHIPARPYLRPALAEAGGDVAAEFRQAARQTVAELARE